MATTVSAIPVERLVLWLNEYDLAGQWFFLSALAKEVGGAVKAAGMLDDLEPHARNAVEFYHGGGC